MPKYQIILEAEKQISDDEFMKEVLLMVSVPSLYGARFFVVMARNLEGIREEVYQAPINFKNYTTSVHFTKEEIQEIRTKLKLKEPTGFEDLL